MPIKKYHVNLKEKELEELENLTNKGTEKIRKYKRAMILLKANQGKTDTRIMEEVEVSRPTVERIRKRFVEGGLERALNDDPRPGQERKLDGRGEAILIATACSEAPEGHAHWTLRMLAGELVRLEVVESISHETVRQTLKKTS